VTAEYTQCIVNEYSPDDSIPFHTDAPMFGPNILVFCMGESRPLLLRRKLGDDGPNPKTFSASIGHGWSYQMSSETRTIWEHAVPSGTGRRTSVRFCHSVLFFLHLL
jgi:alkylated DNA repair dioxygenase AlkB